MFPWPWRNRALNEPQAVPSEPAEAPAGTVINLDPVVVRATAVNADPEAQDHLSVRMGHLEATIERETHKGNLMTPEVQALVRELEIARIAKGYF